LTFYFQKNDNTHVYNMLSLVMLNEALITYDLLVRLNKVFARSNTYKNYLLHFVKFLSNKYIE